MSRHHRFAAAFLLIAATLGLGACASQDPTGLADPKDPPQLDPVACSPNSALGHAAGQVHARIVDCGAFKE